MPYRDAHCLSCFLSLSGPQEQRVIKKKAEDRVIKSPPSILLREHYTKVQEMHQRQFPIPAPIWLPERKGKQHSCYHPSWSGLGEGSSVLQEGCQSGAATSCLCSESHQLPRISFSSAGLVFFPDFSSGSLTYLCLLLQLWGIIKQGYKCKGK